MQKIEALNPETTSGKSKELFDSIQAKLGMIPNMMKTMGNSPAVLGAYLKFSDELNSGSIGGELSELIAISVANVNGCAYCNAAHSFIGEKMIGIENTTIEAAKSGKSSDKKIEAALNFAKALVEKQGRITSDDIESVRSAGFSDAEITEIIAHTTLNIFTNYFNNALNVEVDFPESALVSSYSI